MLLEQPYQSKTINRINESELTYLVNRYIIESYAYLVQSKEIQQKEYKRNGKVLKAVYLFGGSALEADIPDLDFPLIDYKHGWICFDLRKFYSVDKATGTFVPKRSTDIEFLTTRNDLTGVWGVGAVKDLYYFKLPHMAFANWISSLITNRFGLTEKERSDINTIAYVYYSRMFDNGSVNGETIERGDELDRLALRVKETYYTRGMLEDVYSKIDHMETLEDFCSMLYKVTGNVRLSGFDISVLYRLTQTGWMGVDYKQNLAIALEYPPIWIAMCYSALKNNVYKRTTIGDRVEALSKRGEGIAFVKGVDELLTTMMSNVVN